MIANIVYNLVRNMVIANQIIDYIKNHIFNHTHLPSSHLPYIVHQKRYSDLISQFR